MSEQTPLFGDETELSTETDAEKQAAKPTKKTPAKKVSSKASKPKAAKPDAVKSDVGTSSVDSKQESPKPKKQKTSKDNGNRIVLIDGHNLIFRSYYAIRELRNSKGQSTNAIFGFLRSLMQILKDEGEHDATLVTFDAHAKTFRHDKFEGYKAQRAPIPEDLPTQIGYIKEIVRLMGIDQIEVAGLEADDIFGTASAKCSAMGYDVDIISTDKDAFQLISDKVTVYNPVKSLRYDNERVFEEYGVTVEQWVDYRSLTGDSSDNIPGAKGIGPKTAMKLMQAHGSLDYMLEHPEEIKPDKVREKFLNSVEDVKFSRELSEILIDADIDINPAQWAKCEVQEEELVALLTELELLTVIRDLGLKQSVSATQEQLKVETVSYDVVDASEITGGVISFELSNENAPMQASLDEIAIASEGKVAVIEGQEEILAYLAKQESIQANDSKALTLFAKANGIDVTPADDPSLMAYCFDPNQTEALTLTRRYGLTEWDEDDLRKQAEASYELIQHFKTSLVEEQKSVYEDIEKPLSKVLLDMEYTGIALDTEFLKDLSATLGKTVAELEEKVREVADNPLLNLNSRDQLAELLFDKLELKAGKKTTTGKRSTAVSVLEQIRDQHPVVGQILEYRELAKLKSTYIEPLPKLVNPKTGRIHTTFSQTTAVTGRLASLNPNIQNIPVRTDIGRQIRKAFVAAEGCQLLIADYSQIELRVLAHVADEAALITAFNDGEDIHSRTAAQIYDIDLDAVEADMRRVAKTINFGVLYGMGAHRLSRELEIPYAEADSFIKSYFEGFPKIQGYIDGTLEMARNKGYVETLLGRRRQIPDIKHANRNLREYAERTAYNMPIQGTAADIMKLAMIQLDAKLHDFDSKMLLQVHDELIIEAPESEVAEVSEIIETTMQQAYEMKVPLLTEVGVGPNWYEAK